MSMGLSRQEYWSELPFSLPGDLSYLGIKPASSKCHALKADSFMLEPLGKPHKIYIIYMCIHIYTHTHTHTHTHMYKVFRISSDI